MLEFGVAACFLLYLVGGWFRNTRSHWKRVDALDVRIHVNGIRGKSSVARLIAGMLREAGYTTIAKTTGSAAVVIDREGIDHPIIRSGPATILEQIAIIKKWLTKDVNALVIECMAINPTYQNVCERQIVRSQMGVITNVREDHQDVMGETLPEIAVSLLNTTPKDGVLITAETNPDILPVMKAETERRSSEFCNPDKSEVTREDMRGFSHIEFEDNVVLGLEIARRLGIPRDVAMRGMWSATPDPGVLRVENTLVQGIKVTWANMFAVNDRESTIAVFDRVKFFTDEDTVVIAILNNRMDRQQRALQFADIAARDLELDKIVLFGSYEKVVTERLYANGVPAEKIIGLGDETNPSWNRIVQEMILNQNSKHVLIAGMVNIHTHQAEQLMEFFNDSETSELLLEDANSE